MCIQTSHMGQTSARQVLNRLKAFSGGAAGFGFAFTVQMVQQAIDDCLAAQGIQQYNSSCICVLACKIKYICIE